MPPLRNKTGNDLNTHITRSGKTYSSQPYPSRTKRSLGKENNHSQLSKQRKKKADSGSNPKSKARKGANVRSTVNHLIDQSHELARRAIKIVEESSDMKTLKYFAISPPRSYADDPADYIWGRELDGMPDGYPYAVSARVMDLLNIYDVETYKRDQDAFGMHIYSDFTGYGAQEVLENKMNLFTIAMKEKEPNAVRLWTLLSAFAHFTKADEDVMGFWSNRDDADGWRDSTFMVGMMTLATLNALERGGLLVEKSPIKDLGLVLALVGNFVFEQWEIQEEVPCFLSEEAQRWENEHLLEPLPEYLDKPPMEACWPYIIVDYARRHGIKIEGIAGIKERFVDKFGDPEKAKQWAPGPGPDRWGWRSKVRATPFAYNLIWH